MVNQMWVRSIPWLRDLPAAPRRRVAVGLLLILLVVVFKFLTGSESGDAVTTIALGQPLGSSALVVDSRTHHLFVATMAVPRAAPPTSRINVLDTRTATVRATIDVGTNLLPLALDDRLDHLVVASSTALDGGVVRLLDGQTGAIVGSVVIGQPPISLAVNGQAARIYVASGARSTCSSVDCGSTPTVVSVFDAHTLRLLHTMIMSRSLGDLRVDERRGRVFVPTIAGLVVLDADGDRVQQILPGRTVLAVDPLTGHVVVTTADGIAMLDVDTRRLLWRRQELVAGATVDGQTGNVLVMPVATNTVEMLSATTGAVLHAVTVGRLPVSIVVDTGASRVYVVNHDDHNISVLDTLNCRVRRTIPVGPYPVAIVLDPAAHRAIVENTSTYVLRRQDLRSWMPGMIRRWLPFLPGLPVRTIPTVPTSSSVSVLDTSHL
jgi:YVTN family beta-propeller protein